MERRRFLSMIAGAALSFNARVAGFWCAAVADPRPRWEIGLRYLVPALSYSGEMEWWGLGDDGWVRLDGSARDLL